MFKKIQHVYLLKKYIKWGVWRVAVCPSYIQDARFLKGKLVEPFKHRVKSHSPFVDIIKELTLYSTLAGKGLN
jgi:hypothetical protein